MRVALPRDCSNYPQIRGVVARRASPEVPVDGAIGLALMQRLAKPLLRLNLTVSSCRSQTREGQSVGCIEDRRRPRTVALECFYLISQELFDGGLHRLCPYFVTSRV